MKIGIFDLETSGFYADSSILLCCSIKTYGKNDTKTARADEFKTWKSNKSNEVEMIRRVWNMLRPYDILIAHNGEWFDKTYFNAKCMQYELEPILRFKKSIDPVHLSRKHLKLGRNSLAALIDYLKIPVKKTPIELDRWIRASHDGNRKDMDFIVTHCEYDVKTLEMVYDRLRKLVDKIDTHGSSY
jgi:uncharacterized protein YprB with RNaseH-like and TPR domain